MSRLTKVISALGLVLLLSIVFNSHVTLANTDGEFSTPPTDDTHFLGANEGIGGIKINPVNTLASSYFVNGKSFISATGNRVTVSGETTASSPVDRVGVTLYLQRWDASRGVWVTTLSMGGFTEHNASFVVGLRDATVQSGYYYRTLAHHRVIHNVRVESHYSNTSHIYIK